MVNPGAVLFRSANDEMLYGVGQGETEAAPPEQPQVNCGAPAEA